MSIASRLDEAMNAAKIPSQSALARASGIPQPTINRILKGVGKRGPEAHTIVQLAAACNVTFEWLHEGTGPKSRSVAATSPHIESPSQTTADPAKQATTTTAQLVNHAPQPTYIERVSEDELELLGLYRLMRDADQKRTLQGARALPKIALPFATRNQG